MMLLPAAKALQLVKRLPIDLGQGHLRAVTKGKLIALSLVPNATKGDTALDVGCGLGIQTGWLEAKGYEVTSIDIQPVYPRALVVDANRPLPFATESYSVVWCTEVIEHLRDPATSVGEMLRVLKPAGLLVLTTPNSRCWIYRVMAWLGAPPEETQNPAHTHFFAEADIRTLVPGAAVYGYFPYAVVKFTIRRALGLLTPTFVVARWKTPVGRAA
jgi:2-polyprenyl-3-methyl-5-hydroxy-6-metoxy-1,4-benzoquinol methylase